MDDDSAQPPSKQPKRFFDIAPPQDLTPSATSRPVITGNQPLQPDPMMAPTSEQPVVVTSDEAAPEPTDQAATDMMQQEYTEVAHELPSGETELPEPPQLDAPIADTQPVEPQTAPVTSESPVLGEQTSAPDHTSPVVVVHHQRPSSVGKRLLVVLLIIVLLVIAADALLDTGTWKTSVNIPHTHFLHK